MSTPKSQLAIEQPSMRKTRSYQKKKNNKIFYSKDIEKNPQDGRRGELEIYSNLIFPWMGNAQTRE